MVNILDFAGHMALVAITKFYGCSQKATMEQDANE